MVRVKVRVFTFPSDPREQNSYVVGTMEGGHLPIVGTIQIDADEAKEITFAAIRPRIELKDDSGMIRRSQLFQEALAISAASPNPHRWPLSALQTYWFGYFTDVNETIPQIVPVSEEKMPLSKYLNMTTSKVTGDLILVPQTQFGPVCEQCCAGCDKCPPISTSAKVAGLAIGSQRTTSSNRQ